MSEYVHAEYVRRLVDQAPPLSEATRALLVAALEPVAGDVELIPVPVSPAPRDLDESPAAA